MLEIKAISNASGSIFSANGPLSRDSYIILTVNQLASS